MEYESVINKAQALLPSSTADLLEEKLQSGLDFDGIRKPLNSRLGMAHYSDGM